MLIRKTDIKFCLTHQVRNVFYASRDQYVAVKETSIYNHFSSSVESNVLMYNERHLKRIKLNSTWGFNVYLKYFLIILSANYRNVG